MPVRDAHHRHPHYRVMNDSENGLSRTRWRFCGVDNTISSKEPRAPGNWSQSDMKSVIELEILPAHKHPESNRSELPAGAAIDWKFLLVSLACFIVGLAACLLHNLSKSSLASVWLFDSGHYLVTCEQVAHFWRQLAHGLS